MMRQLTEIRAQLQRLHDCGGPRTPLEPATAAWVESHLSGITASLEALADRVELRAAEQAGRSAFSGEGGA